MSTTKKSVGIVTWKKCTILRKK